MIYVIGDSHAQLFGNITGCKVLGNRPWCAQNVPDKPDIPNEIKKNIKVGDKIIFVFGEVDCRLHFSYQSIKQKVPVDNLIDATIKKYGEFVKGVRDMGYDVAIYNVVPTGTWAKLRDGERECPEINMRKTIYRGFHDKMSKFCEENNLKIIDMWDKVAGEDGFTKKEYRADKVHLNNKVLPILEEELKQVFKT